MIYKCSKCGSEVNVKESKYTPVILDGMNCSVCKGPLFLSTSNGDRKTKDHLLTISLDKYNGVPTVYYKGEEINNKVRILFDWETDGLEKKYPTILIEYIEEEDGRVVHKHIGLSVESLFNGDFYM